MLPIMPIMVETPTGPPLLRVEYKNVRPVDLIDLATSFRAFGEAFADFAHDEGFDVEPRNVKLCVHRLSTGSIIGDLAPYAEQASWVLDQAKTLAPFVTVLSDLTSYFLGSAGWEKRASPPTRRQAEQVHAIMEPTARDHGSTLVIGTNTGVVFQNCTFSSETANAIQNGAKRFLAPHIPDQLHLDDQTLVLHQVRGDLKGAAGDRGIIKALSPKHVKLSFVSPEAKAAIIDTHDNPFKMGFLVEVDVTAHEGKPALYRIRAVKESFDLPE